MTLPRISGALHAVTLATLSILLSACCTDFSSRPTIRTPSGDLLCARHRIPLVPVRAYQHREPWPMMDPVPQVERLWKCNPNSISSGVGYHSLHRDATYTKPIRLHHCPRCQAALDRWLANTPDRCAIFAHFLKIPLPRAFPISLAANSLSYLLLEFTLGPIFRILR